MGACIPATSPHGKSAGSLYHYIIAFAHSLAPLLNKIELYNRSELCNCAKPSFPFLRTRKSQLRPCLLTAAAAWAATTTTWSLITGWNIQLLHRRLDPVSHIVVVFERWTWRGFLEGKEEKSSHDTTWCRGTRGTYKNQSSHFFEIFHRTLFPVHLVLEQWKNRQSLLIFVPIIGMTSTFFSVFFSASLEKTRNYSDNNQNIFWGTCQFLYCMKRNVTVSLLHNVH